MLAWPGHFPRPSKTSLYCFKALSLLLKIVLLTVEPSFLIKFNFVQMSSPNNGTDCTTAMTNSTLIFHSLRD